MINVEISVHVMMVMEIFVVVNILFFIDFQFQRNCFYLLEDKNIDKSLLSIPLINKTLEDNPIYSTPILVIAGLFLLDF